MTAQVWETLIREELMGIFALVRNLRNFDQAGVSDEAAALVCAKLTDPDVIARSRMLPFRFWAAYKHTDSLRWAHALETALGLSLRNVPALPGRTLVLVDRSPSMFPGYGFSTPNSSDITLAEQAAVFGAALALRAANATLIEFGKTSQEVRVPKGGSMLKLIEQFTIIDSTDIPSAVAEHYAKHDRIVIVTDEQTRPGYLPSNCTGHGGMPETRDRRPRADQHTGLHVEHGRLRARRDAIRRRPAAHLRGALGPGIRADPAARVSPGRGLAVLSTPTPETTTPAPPGSDGTGRGTERIDVQLCAADHPGQGQRSRDEAELPQPTSTGPARAGSNWTALVTRSRTKSSSG